MKPMWFIVSAMAVGLSLRCSAANLGTWVGGSASIDFEAGDGASQTVTGSPPLVLNDSHNVNGAVARGALSIDHLELPNEIGFTWIPMSVSQSDPGGAHFANAASISVSMDGWWYFNHDSVYLLGHVSLPRIYGDIDGVGSWAKIQVDFEWAYGPTREAVHWEKTYSSPGHFEDSFFDEKLLWWNGKVNDISNPVPAGTYQELRGTATLSVRDFGATGTSITAVPEPSGWFSATGVALVAFGICNRRRVLG